MRTGGSPFVRFFSEKTSPFFLECVSSAYTVYKRGEEYSLYDNNKAFFLFQIHFSLSHSLLNSRRLYSIEAFRPLLRRPRPEVAGSREYTPRAGLTSSSLSFCYQHQHHPRRRLRRRLRKVSSSFSSLLFSSSPSLSNRPCSLFARA